MGWWDDNDPNTNSQEDLDAIAQADANRRYERDNPEYGQALDRGAPRNELDAIRAKSTQPGGASPPSTVQAQLDANLAAVQAQLDAKNGKSGGSGGSSGGSGDYDGFGQAWLAWANANRKWTPAGLKEFVAANPQYGAEIFGTKGDKVRVGGRAYDAIIASGMGGTGAAWNYLDPNKTSSSSGSLANPGGSVVDFVPQAWDKKFEAPNREQALADEGFQFTLTRGREALERSAAAKGTLLTTGTLKDLDQQSQGLASQQYDKVYGRRMGEYQGQFNEFLGNESARFGAHQANFGNNLAVNQNQFNQGLLTNQNAFNQQFSLADLGMRAANSANMNAGNYGNNVGDLYGQQGNVNAAGQVGSANAWNQGLGSLANLGQYYAGLYNRPQMPRAGFGQGYGVYQ